MSNKKYLNISEVSKLLQIKEHKIRYWDSINPKTNKYRIEGISTKSKGGTRYFNKENIEKLQKLKSILYEGKIQNYSIKLAEKILFSDNKYAKKYDQNKTDYQYSDHDKKIEQILFKMRLLLKNDRLK